MEADMYLRVLFLLLAGTVACSGGGGRESAATDVDVRAYADIPVKKDDDNAPPQLHKIGNKEAQVGEELVITLVADDPDSETLTYSVYGDLPPQAKFYKPEGRFVWTPDSAGGPFFVTFVVSDMKDFDSETVELRAVTTKTQHPPMFEPMGDQFLKIGEIYELRLEATDEDGDVLQFSILSGAPESSTFDAQNGLFRWTPKQDDAGAQHRVTFQVSDGALTDEVEVRLIVEGGALNNHPPEIQTIGSVEAEVGVAMKLEVTATDDDDDDLAYSVDGELPDKAQFDTSSHVFSWTPPASYAGKSVYVVFSVTDGTYTVKDMANILVKEKSSSCGDDDFEPNNKAEAATQITEGVFANLSICDTQLSPIDEDWFKLLMEAGEHVDATIEYNHAAGNLDLPLYAATDLTKPAVYAPVDGNEETVAFTAPQAGTYYLRVVGTEAWKYAVPYTLEVVRSTGQSCVADTMEPNDSIAQAPTLPPGDLDGTPVENLSICPGDVDVFGVPAATGDSLLAAINFAHGEGDLDLVLYDPSGQYVLDQSAGQTDFETVALEGVPANATYFVVVSGFPTETTENTYSLEVLKEQGAGCTGDTAEPNDSSGQAEAVTQSQELAGLTLCGDEDWYSFPPAPGSVEASLDYADGTSVSAWFVTSSDLANKIPLSCAAGNCSGSHALPSAGTLFLLVEGDYGASYELTVTLDTESTTDSCEGKCGGSGGDCWCDEGCIEYGDCCPDACELCGFCYYA